MYTFGGFAVLAAERGTPVKLSWSWLATYVRETMATLLMVLTTPFGKLQRPPRRQEPRPELASQVPVVLVHGLGAHRATMMFLSTFLVYRGWRWAWPVNLARQGASVPDHATRLGQHVRELCRASGAEQVDLVCHSFGGVVAAWYLRHQDGAPRVRRLVTLATPFAGTRTAVFAWGADAESLLPGSHALDELVPPPVPTVCIWSPDDEIVVPSSSALPEGVEGICIEGAGHNDLLVSARAFRAIQAALVTGTEVAA